MIYVVFFYGIDISFVPRVHHIHNFFHWSHGMSFSYYVLGERRFIIVVRTRQKLCIMLIFELSSSLSRINKIKSWVSKWYTPLFKTFDECEVSCCLLKSFQILFSF
jgi:hypothetical protein